MVQGLRFRVLETIWFSVGESAIWFCFGDGFQATDNPLLLKLTEVPHLL